MCPRRLTTWKPPKRAAKPAMAWRPVPVPSKSVPADASTGQRGEPSRRHTRRRRRRLTRRETYDSSSPSGPDEPTEPAPVVFGATAPVGPVGGFFRPTCVIDRSARIEQVENNLRRALLVTVGGNRPVFATEKVLEEVARVFNFDMAAMTIMPAAPDDFLLVLPDCDVAETVFNRGQPLHGLGVSLYIKWWSQLPHADGASLPAVIDLELHGIPAHAWEMSMAQHLLNGSCWVRSLHLEMATRQGLSVFHVAAWCMRPKLVHPAIDLIIPEPAPPEAEVPPAKRGLVYPIDLSFTPAPSEAGSRASSPQPPAPDHERRCLRNWGPYRSRRAMWRPLIPARPATSHHHLLWPH